MKITFLHTSNVHIKRFDKILSELDESIEVEHYVKEELLEFAQRTGEVDKKGFQKALIHIQNNEHKFIVCTCSTYGDLCDERDNIYRIDQPIGEFIVSKYSNIGIAYTLASTKAKSKELIESLAKKARKSIRIIEIDCTNCWEWFDKGNLEKYESEIAHQIRRESNHCEVVFLAQASMEGAKKQLTDENYPVVSSPEFGVKKYLEMIKKKLK